MDKTDYLLAFCFLLMVFNVVLYLQRYIRKKERRDIFSFLFYVYICVCLIITYFTSFSVMLNLFIMGLTALFIVLIPWVFIRMRIKNTGT